ncbi:UvrD-helicase domain-containing protein, partial [bacterium]|nr:UvrD-helicase domain-containing protein [bacterium]
MSTSDAQAREMALNPYTSFIVQAPAGSGKTGLLTQRYLVLLSIVQEPEDILAITFTNKAAGEMRDRIIKALLQAKNESCPEDPFQAKTWHLARRALQMGQKKEWSLLENPTRLNIRTIDSFCSYLTKYRPMASRFGSSLSPDPHQSELYNMAATNAVNQLLYSKNEDLRELKDDLEYVLLNMFDNDQHKLEVALADILGGRGRWLNWLKADDLRSQIENSYSLWRDNLVKEAELSSLLSEDEYLIVKRACDELLDFCGGVPQADTDNGRELAEAISLLSDCKSIWQKWACLGKILLSTSGSLRKLFNASKNYNFIPEASIVKKQPERFHYLTEMRQLFKDEGWQSRTELADRLRASVNCFGPAKLTEESWQDIERILHLAKFTATELEKIFSNEMRCDYEEISAGALQVSDPLSEERALGLRDVAKHILIDEYQDTSWQQYELINNLLHDWTPQICSECYFQSKCKMADGKFHRECEGEGRTIFCVGDPMQSIYRFRGADVSVYNYTQTYGFGEGVGIVPRSLLLRNNFRTNCNLVDLLSSEIFKKIFPSNREHFLSHGEVNFAEPSPQVHNITKEPIIIEPILSTSEDCDPLKLEAKLIARRITRLRQEAPQEVCAVLLESKDLGAL